MRRKLIFVYNADSGLFNTLTDIAHKLFSPHSYPCTLCALTHSPVAMRGAWKAFIAGLDAECEFLHRDQFRTRYPTLEIPLPAVLYENGGDARLCLPADSINQCQEIGALEQLIVDHCLAVSASDRP